MSLVTAMLMKNPAQRPSIHEVLNHPWVQGKVPDSEEICAVMRAREQILFPDLEVDKMNINE